MFDCSEKRNGTGREIIRWLIDQYGEGYLTATIAPTNLTSERAFQSMGFVLINEDEDVSFLVLAAGSSKEGPGPLVSTLAGRAASTFPIPIVIVPGGLTDEEIDALAG